MRTLPRYKIIMRVFASISIIIGIFAWADSNAQNIMQQIYSVVEAVGYYVFACALLLF